MIPDRRRLADALKRARGRHGLGQTEAGERAGRGQSKISKIERGFLLPSVQDVAALCEAYHVPAAERDDLATALREQQSARVILARGVAETRRRIGQLGEASKQIRGYQPVMVDGLLQTEGYARHVFGRDEAGVTARIARQAVLQDKAKQLRLVSTEGALRWQAGSPAVMVEQIEAIVAAASPPALRVGIIPWTTPVHVFPRHGFHIYDEDAVIVGTETATATMTGEADVATYLELFDKVMALAAFGHEAEEHFTRIAGDYRRLGK